MKISNYYYKVLNISPEDNLEQVKKAYRKLMKENHPDFFPEEKQELQKLKTIQINEAYKRILDTFKDKTDKVKNPSIKTYTQNETTQKDNKTVGFHKDLSYVYYKRGFENFSNAVNITNRKSGFNIDTNFKMTNSQFSKFYSEPMAVKKFTDSLRFLRVAETYFSKVVSEYPNSIWVKDSEEKIERIEYFYELYNTILKNVEKYLKNPPKYKFGVGIRGFSTPI